MTCLACGTDRCHLIWASMESWDLDGWGCINGHTWAEQAPDHSDQQGQAPS